MGINLLIWWAWVPLTSSSRKCSHVGFPCIRSQRDWHKIRDRFCLFFFLNFDLNIQLLGLQGPWHFVAQFILSWASCAQGSLLSTGTPHLWVWWGERLRSYRLGPQRGPLFLGAEWHLIYLISAEPGVLSLSQMPPTQHMLTSLCSTCLSPRNNLSCLSSLTEAHLLAMAEYCIRHLL